jgi:hypothetical protein
MATTGDPNLAVDTVWTESASNLSSLDPSGAYWVDAEHPTRNRKVAVQAIALTMPVDLQVQPWPCSVACH